MEISELEKYRPLYLSMERMGAGRILKEFLRRDLRQTLPFSVSHGVDFGHCFDAMDIEDIEPVHWAYNDVIKDRVSGKKNYILAPHPWAILHQKLGEERGAGTLIIGPPPGVDNDRKLYDLIRHCNIGKANILIKGVGNYLGSIEFWKSKGVEPVTAGFRDIEFYDRLFSLLSRYDRVIGSNLSSAIVFAASIGKKIEFVDGFSYEFYDRGDYLNRVNFESEDARSFIKFFFYGGGRERKELSQNLLGYEYLSCSKMINNNIENVLSELKSPVYVSNNKKPFHLLRLFAAVKFNRPGLIRSDFFSLVRNYFFSNGHKNKVCKVELNELSAWLNGVSSDNFQITPTPYVKGVTVPGQAVTQYPE
ncbi:hypothetical protein [Marinobacter mobilis]|uniref:Uncharacterized protein n=1 Tax=Marinobacter mobilis TaxID=488533 RepID=A0A1H2TJE7_9GAMM|nr:hypothetical protein [Marinobacter mobilis]SDW44073.1 hypothetical protein SAMN04487960_102464 [Marinobacter mobilis]